MSKEVELLKGLISVEGMEYCEINKEDVEVLNSAITALEAIEKAGEELPTKEKLESIFREVFVSEVHNENLLMVLAKTALKEVKPIIAKKDIRIKELEDKLKELHDYDIKAISLSHEKGLIHPREYEIKALENVLKENINLQAKIDELETKVYKVKPDPNHHESGITWKDMCDTIANIAENEQEENTKLQAKIDELENRHQSLMKALDEGLSPEQLHIWYLEAITSGVAGEQYNPNAIKSYNDLSFEQQCIDKYISNKVTDFIKSKLTGGE